MNGGLLDRIPLFNTRFLSKLIDKLEKKDLVLLIIILFFSFVVLILRPEDLTSNQKFLVIFLMLIVIILYILFPQNGKKGQPKIQRKDLRRQDTIHNSFLGKGVLPN